MIIYDLPDRFQRQGIPILLQDLLRRITVIGQMPYRPSVSKLSGKILQ